jgi:DNA-binding response OmpR family regulator
MAKLLIAENELALREFIARGLEQRGHKVTTAQDGSEAVDALKKHKFDLLLTDIDMPIMDGIALSMTVEDEDHHHVGPRTSDRTRPRHVGLGLPCDLEALHDRRNLRRRGRGVEQEEVAFSGGFLSPHFLVAAKNEKSNPFDAFARLISAALSVWNPFGIRLRSICVANPNGSFVPFRSFNPRNRWANAF